ncbi:hypothetical protein CU098_003483, partial [Rhizopus stolonifer]
FVKAKFTEEQLRKADRLRIVFHATESIYSSAYIIPIYNNQLFGTQKTLWKRKNNMEQTSLKWEPGVQVSIPFIVQLPLVQFPPSANITSDGKEMSYQCRQVLSAYLDDSEASVIAKCHKSINYIPFVETGISKKPINISNLEKTPLPDNDNTKQPSVNVNLHSLDYISGDKIPLSLTFHHIPKKSIDSVSFRLYQVQTWNKITRSEKSMKGEFRSKHLVSQNTINSLSESVIIESGSNSVKSSLSTSLQIPVDTLPTFTYSPVFSLYYSLEITITKKGKLWSHKLDLNHVPIKIGTLGYGIRSSEEIKIYSVFASVFDHQANQRQGTVLPVPRFLNVIEYEDALPVYINEQLPTYESVVKT